MIQDHRVVDGTRCLTHCSGSKCSDYQSTCIRLGFLWLFQV